MTTMTIRVRLLSNHQVKRLDVDFVCFSFQIFTQQKYKNRLDRLSCAHIQTNIFTWVSSIFSTSKDGFPSPLLFEEKITNCFLSLKNCGKYTEICTFKDRYGKKSHLNNEICDFHREIWCFFLFILFFFLCTLCTYDSIFHPICTF